jgi:hypothetical protein
MIKKLAFVDYMCSTIISLGVRSFFPAGFPIPTS